MFQIDLVEQPGGLPSIHIGGKYVNVVDPKHSELIDRLIVETKETEGVLQALASNYKRSSDKMRIQNYIRELFEITRFGSESTRRPPTTDPSWDDAELARNLSIANIQLALIRIKGLRKNVTLLESGVVKNKYVAHLGIYAAIFATVSFLTYAFIRFVVFTTPWNPAMDALGLAGMHPAEAEVNVSKAKHSGHDVSVIVRNMNFLLLIGASAVGSWLSFSIRKVELSFGDLAAVEKDRLTPLLRLLFVGGLTFTVGLALSAGVVRVQVGAFNSDFLLSGSTALLLGLLCGVIEAALSNVVGRQASMLRDSFGGDATEAAAAGPVGPGMSRSGAASTGRTQELRPADVPMPARPLQPAKTHAMGNLDLS